MRCLPSITVHSFVSFPCADEWEPCYLHRFRRYREALVLNPHCCAPCQACEVFSDTVLGPHTLLEPATLVLFSSPGEPSPFWYNGSPLSDKFSLIISVSVPVSGCLPRSISLWQLPPRPWGPKYQLTLAGEVAGVQGEIHFSSSWWAQSPPNKMQSITQLSILQQWVFLNVLIQCIEEVNTTILGRAVLIGLLEEVWLWRFSNPAKPIFLSSVTLAPQAPPPPQKTPTFPEFTDLRSLLVGNDLIN